MMPVTAFNKAAANRARTSKVKTSSSHAPASTSNWRRTSRPTPRRTVLVVGGAVFDLAGNTNDSKTLDKADRLDRADADRHRDGHGG